MKPKGLQQLYMYARNFDQLYLSARGWIETVYRRRYHVIPQLVQSGRMQSSFYEVISAVLLCCSCTNNSGHRILLIVAHEGVLDHRLTSMMRLKLSWYGISTARMYCDECLSIQSSSQTVITYGLTVLNFFLIRFLRYSPEGIMALGFINHPTFLVLITWYFVTSLMSTVSVTNGYIHVQCCKTD